jgi:hypothetical protein
MIIIIYLLGLAPAGCLTASDNGASAGYAGVRVKTQMRPLSRCAIEPAESGGIRKPPRRKKITTQVWRMVTICHTRTPLTLNRPHLASLQLCSLLVYG